MKRAILLFVFATILAKVHGQSASKLIKQAEKHFNEFKFTDAVKVATEAIQLEPQKGEAYLIRAKAYKQIGKNAEAIEDFQKVAGLDPKNYQVFYEIAAIHLSEDNFKEAINAFDQLLAIQPKHFDAQIKKAKAQIKLEEYGAALESAKRALSIDKNDIWALYHAGEASHGLGNLNEAEKYFNSAASNADAVIKKNMNAAPLYGVVFQQLGLVQLKLSKLDAAEATLTKAINADPQNPAFYLSRGQVMAAKSNYQNALNDYGQAIALRPRYVEAYLHRAKVNEKLGQLQLAVNDYNQVLAIQPEHQAGLIGRATAFMAQKQLKDAMRDLKKAMKLNPDNKEAADLLAKAKEELYIQNIEKNVPEIILKKPETKNQGISIREDQRKLMVEFMVKDASPMKTVKVNSKELETDDETINPTFITEVEINQHDELKILATDIYLNSTELVIPIIRTENNPPVIKIIRPYTTDDHELFTDSKSVLFVEGEIHDQSKITSILINDSSADFSSETLNPKFTATVSINSKDTLTILATDIHGNRTLSKYFLVRSDSAQANIMGLTWMVIIQNTDYENWPKIEGSENDIKDLRSSLSNYHIGGLEVKRNQTKAQLEKYFTSDLLNQIQKNKVKSLLIWYSGHGKFLNETGYWIPTDGSLQDETSYYNVNALKNALQTYTGLDHILIVSNACELGTGFYTQDSNEISDKRCNEPENIKNKSARVFTSSSTDQTNDYSLFTQAFVNALNNSKDPCISAETLAYKVTNIIKQNRRPIPKYGKIKGLNDENGSFYFIRRK